MFYDVVMLRYGNVKASVSSLKHLPHIECSRLRLQESESGLKINYSYVVILSISFLGSKTMQEGSVYIVQKSDHFGIISKEK